MNSFCDIILPHIDYPFVLITHDSDIPAPNGFHNILNHPHLSMWFAMNCHEIHPKLQPIPIGMANECWPHGDKQIIHDTRKLQSKKDNLVYCNFNSQTNPTERAATLHDLKTSALRDFIDFEVHHLPYREYIQKLDTYKYVISPPGNSVDCHRIWESMYIGTVPICLKSIPLLYFKDSPILFVNDWVTLTPEVLLDNYTELINRSRIKGDFTYYKAMIELASHNE